MATATAVPPRNLLLIIADDVGIDSLALFNDDAGASFPPTPTLNGLAQRGISFSRAYAYPTCSPTRAAILTGRYGYRTGVFSPQSAHLHADEYTLPEVLANSPQLGYRLASVGKWHLGSGNAGPNVIGGWPHFSGVLSGALNNYRRWDKVVNGAVTSLTNSYATRVNVSDAIDWVSGQGTNRWFLWVGFNAAHTPLHKPPTNMHSYGYLSGTEDDIATNSRPYFEAMVEAMDFQVGRLLDNVDTNETTVIFIGDNGTSGDVIQPPYDISNRAKGTLFEGGTHVPMIIAGPDVVNGGRTNDAVVHCVDIFSTIIELAGGTVPPGTGEDSRSLVPVLEDTAFSPAEDCILVESDSLGGASDFGRAVRNNEHKLIRIEGRADRFYDMNADPLESTNLLSGMLTPEQQAAFDLLSAKLDSWTNARPTVTESGYPIVDTGQHNCYDDQGGYTIAAPAPGQAFAGQDGQYAGCQPYYWDNGDGTISDLKTGLMWQKTPDLTNKASWASALTDAVNQATGGYTDWRLPSIKELYSLIDFTGDTGSSETDAVPYIDTRYFEFVYGDTNTERYIDAQYWSATEYVHTTMNGDDTVFGVNFADGRIKGYPKVKPAGGGDNLASVRYVRGNLQYGMNDFVDSGNGTVIDMATGLMWQQGDSVDTQNWEQALAYAEGLELAGYRDWRLPNAKELQGIVDYTRAPMATGSAAIDTNFLHVTETESFYWASTTHLDGAPETRGDYAVYLCFGRALGWMEQPPNSGTNVLLDVHGAGAQRSDPKSGNPADYPYGHGPQGDVIRIYNYTRCVRGGADEAVLLDTDLDGLSDRYEHNYSGNTTNMAPTADDDSDGFVNSHENRAGTIPTDEASYLAIRDIALASSNGIAVSWSSEMDRSYSLTSTTNLVDTPFTPLESGIGTTPRMNTFIDNTATNMNQVYYRIELEE
jgi:arylsulfatase A-like enzyme